MAKPFAEAVELAQHVLGQDGAPVIRIAVDVRQLSVQEPKGTVEMRPSLGGTEDTPPESVCPRSDEVGRCCRAEPVQAGHGPSEVISAVLWVSPGRFVE